MIMKLLAWGQYVHWAELQFRRYVLRREAAPTAELIGIVAHWLAAEFVVLEFASTVIPSRSFTPMAWEALNRS